MRSTTKFSSHSQHPGVASDCLCSGNPLCNPANHPRPPTPDTQPPSTRRTTKALRGKHRITILEPDEAIPACMQREQPARITFRCALEQFFEVDSVGVASRLVAMCIGFTLLPVTIRHAGASTYGLYAAVTAFSQLYSPLLIWESATAGYPTDLSRARPIRRHIRRVLNYFAGIGCIDLHWGDRRDYRCRSRVLGFLGPLPCMPLDLESRIIENAILVLALSVRQQPFPAHSPRNYF